MTCFNTWSAFSKLELLKQLENGCNLIKMILERDIFKRANNFLIFS
jgi:hypothetical protein